MDKRIYILIGGSLLALIALSGIQYYLISDAYAVKKEAFMKEVRGEMKFLDSEAVFDDLEDAYVHHLQAAVKQGFAQGWEQERMLGGFRKFLDSLNQGFQAAYTRELEKRNLPYHIDYQKDITGMYLFDIVKNDTLMSTGKQEFLLFGKDLEPDNRMFFNSGRWESSSFSDDGEDLLPEQHWVSVIELKEYVSVPNSKSIIFKRMAGILALSIGSLLVVIILFVAALRSLLTQKKLADIKTDFINNITHELNTPLATLEIATKTLRNPKVQHDPVLLEKGLDTVSRQSDRLRGLVDQVVNHSLGHKAIGLRKEEIEPQLFLKDLVDDFSIKVPQKSVSMLWGQKVPKLCIDPFQWTTALQNVLNNAVKYGGNQIDIESTLDQGYWRITISDDGPGIPKNEQTAVFDKFYRVKMGNLHNVKGLGLGLYYVKQIVTAHNGSLSLASEPGQYTAITLKIPVQ
ncbi:sensor histidine kinase [Sediminicola luteus]|nr:HAMP domain-containing sensor histidine kinase [Sediminicola luteus]